MEKIEEVDFEEDRYCPVFDGAMNLFLGYVS